MAGRRCEVTDVREVLRRFHLGEPDRRIGRELGLSRNPVSSYRRWAERPNLLHGPLPDAASVAALLRPPERARPHGQNEILHGLEAGLDGMERGAAKVITVEPVDAYGEIHPEGFFEVQRERVPAEAQRIGTRLETTAPDRRVVFPYVAEIRPDGIVLGLNHPLAGRTLRFDVRVVDIQRGELQLSRGECEGERQRLNRPGPGSSWPWTGPTWP